MQSKLLRVLEDRRVRPVGSEREVPVDLRLIFATNADLQKEVEKGRFRGRLLLPPETSCRFICALKDRGDDVQELAHHLHDQALGHSSACRRSDRRAVRAAFGELRLAGNVRELRNLIERTLILGAFPDDFAGPRSEGQPAAADSLADWSAGTFLLS
jgi:DNA-binding NtrC family response regulator